MQIRIHTRQAISQITIQRYRPKRKFAQAWVGPVAVTEVSRKVNSVASWPRRSKYSEHTKTSYHLLGSQRWGCIAIVFRRAFDDVNHGPWSEI